MSGYDENYRYQIIKSGVEGFDKMLQREANEGVPINKPRAYKFRCTIVRSFQRANTAMLKKIIYVVSVIHRV